MKVLYLLLVLTFLYSCYSRECTGLATKASECNDALLDTKKYYRCCYVDAEAEKYGSEFKFKFCVPVVESVYKNITALINEATKKAKQMADVEFKVSVDCNCNYIGVSILLIALLLL